MADKVSLSLIEILFFFLLIFAVNVLKTITDVSHLLLFHTFPYVDMSASASLYWVFVNMAFKYRHSVFL